MSENPPVYKRFFKYNLIQMYAIFVVKEARKAIGAY